MIELVKGSVEMIYSSIAHGSMEIICTSISYVTEAVRKTNVLLFFVLAFLIIIIILLRRISNSLIEQNYRNKLEENKTK